MGGRYHLEKLNRGKLLSIYQLAFLTFSGMALFSCFQSPFINQYISVGNIGWFFVAGNLLSLLSYQFVPGVVKYLGRYKSTILFIIIFFFLIGLLAIVETKWVVLTVLVLYVAATPLIEIVFDFLVESFSEDRNTGQIRSIYNTIIDAGWVLAAALGGYLLSNYSFQTMFAIITVAILMVGVVFIWRFKATDFTSDFHHYFKINLIWRAFFNKQVKRPIFFLYFIISFFFSWMVIYTPLYLSQLGLEWVEIGEILAVTYLAYILFDYPTGWMVDKKVREEYIIMIGVILISLTTLGIIFISSTTVSIWMFILFVGRLGCSLMYNANDSYFFKSIDQRDVELMAVYRGVGLLARIVAPLVAVLLLRRMELVYLFPILGIMMLSGVWFSYRLKPVSTKL